ncbi:hypothetical protein SK128_005213 [Halocaridina rubra]|uniref:Uncharacterized protein n=1 Tax=Halocaridina rubra TaxID=373956 RepID=A0AAN8WNH9_HALRR
MDERWVLERLPCFLHTQRTLNMNNHTGKPFGRGNMIQPSGLRVPIPHKCIGVIWQSFNLKTCVESFLA